MRTRLHGLCALLASLATSWSAFCQPRFEDPPVVLHPLGAANAIDARGRFRQIFCATSNRIGSRFPDVRNCAEALVRLGDEPQTATGLAHGKEFAPPRTIVILPGIFGECVSHLGTPFSDAYEYLRSQGNRVLVVPVEGRSSSERNAAIIDRYLAGNLGPDEDVVVIGYSKGVSDFLETLSSYRASPWLRQIRAFVSVAGVVGGTPIADTYAPLYAGLLAQLPANRCGPGDGQAVQSLTRKTRMAWLAAHRIPQHIKLFSLLATPASVGSNPLFLPFAAQLSMTDARNDGQVLIQDAVLPGSYVLGYANADHWAIALPFNRNSSAEAIPLGIANSFPREVLVVSVLAFVEEVIAGVK